VFAWHRRGTRNARKDKFPQPAYELDNPARSTKGRLMFRFQDVLDWYSAGPSAASREAVYHNESEKRKKSSPFAA
jgi:hypothetical protein